MRKRLVRLGVLVSVFWASAAASNPTIGISLFEAVQRGEGAVVAVYPEGGEVESTVLSIERKIGEEGKMIAEQFAASTLDLQAYCGSEWIDESYCAENEGECADCDDDGAFECTEGCLDMLLFEDDCVPVGTAVYSLHLHFEEDCMFVNDESLEMPDAGQDCPPNESDFVCEDGDEPDSGAHSDADTDSDSDADTDDDAAGDEPGDKDAGCSVAPNAGADHSLLSFLIDIAR